MAAYTLSLIHILAIEKRIAIDTVEVVLTDPDCPVKLYNPLGKVPVLVLPDGDSLYDSRVIVEYLDNRTPGAHLIPQDNTGKTEVRRWEALADGVCDAAVSAMLEQRKPEAQQSSAHIEKQLEKVTRGLAVLNLDLTKKKWCVNEQFSLADIALGCALAYLDLRFTALNWQEKYPNLAKHYNVLAKRASFKQTMPVA